MNNNIPANSKESTSDSIRSAFLFLADELKKGVVTPASVSDIRRYIVNHYIPLETTYLRKRLQSSEFSNVRLVLRPNGLITFRVKNVHITKKQLENEIGLNNEFFLRTEFVSHTLKALETLKKLS